MSDVDGFDIVSKIEAEHFPLEVRLGLESSLDRGDLTETVLFAFELEIRPRHTFRTKRLNNHLRLVRRTRARLTAGLLRDLKSGQ
jgi:hypothetical protein